ncbi:MAG: response regulator [Dehalococcoidia bacterium]
MLKPLNPKNSSVLVVEDSPDDARIVQRTLGNFGIRKLFIAPTAEDAFAFLREHRCDVILLDYHLPGMNGLRLLERIKESWPDVRVIMVTGANDDEVAASALKLGAADYVPKNDLLTSGLVRSLQATLREQSASTDEEQRSLLSSDANKFDVAAAEGEWLLNSLAFGAGAPVSDGAARPAPETKSDRWQDAFRVYEKYLREGVEQGPETATSTETGLARILQQQGFSPREVVALHQAAVQSLGAKGVEAQCSPTACLARIFGRLIEEYQRRDMPRNGNL